MITRIKSLAIAAVIVAPTPVPAVTAHDTHEPPSRTAHVLKSGQEPTKTPDSRKYTPEDYWVPLEKWLKKQGSPLSGRDFYEVGKKSRIDPDMLIAITKAETQLCTVKQRGSKYNCGSVGSYDSTNTTYHSGSYRHGIEQIAATLNNPMLGRYKTVGELSRAHNPSGPVYATSPVNWERNVLTTLSALKGKQIDHRYNFRR